MEVNCKMYRGHNVVNNEDIVPKQSQVKNILKLTYNNYKKAVDYNKISGNERRVPLLPGTS